MFKKIDKNLITYLVAAVFLILLFVFLITSTWIGYGVEDQCRLAKQKYEGDCVEALMSSISDESTKLGKNSAIWALGQLGDRRALPLLESYYSGVKKERESWEEGISQYELNKAIKLLKSGFNLTAFVWR